jgi:hypothetical protein
MMVGSDPRGEFSEFVQLFNCYFQSYLSTSPHSQMPQPWKIYVSRQDVQYNQCKHKYQLTSQLCLLSHILHTGPLIAACTNSVPIIFMYWSINVVASVEPRNRVETSSKIITLY